MYLHNGGNGTVAVDATRVIIILIKHARASTCTCSSLRNTIGKFQDGRVLCYVRSEVQGRITPNLKAAFFACGPCWPRSSENLIPETGGKEREGERKETREDLGAWSTVYRYHVSLSLSHSFPASI